MTLPNPIPVNPLDLPHGEGVPAPRLGSSQDLAFAASGGSPTSTTPFGAGTSLLQITMPPSTISSGARIRIGYSPVVSATDPLVIPGSIMYYRAYPGEQLSAISNDANTGTLNVVECVTLPVP